MGYLKGTDRKQIQAVCLDDMVGAESTARIIDAFVDAVDLKTLGFLNTTPNATGRSSYSPGHLAKLYIFGYTHAVRSSRRLERICNTDVEAMWLMEGLAPDFKTIADFRKDNTSAICALFAEFTEVCKQGGLIGAKFCAIDGTKIKASNAKKRNLTKKALTKRIEHNKKRAREYLDGLDESDTREAKSTRAKAETCNRRREKQEALLHDMDEAEVNEVSLTDGDSRLMSNGKGGVEVAYNVQASVDGKANIVAALDVVSEPNDTHQLAAMVEQTQKVYGRKKITVLADKGYSDPAQIAKSTSSGARVIVAGRSLPGEKTGGFGAKDFRYDALSDCYTCPAGHILHAHSARSSERRRYFDRSTCVGCSLKDGCVPKKSEWRTLNRDGYSDIRDHTRKLFDENREFYRKRQQTVEPVFGTVKRSMDGGYFLTRGLDKVKAEACLLFTCYNIKRALGALGFEGLMEAIRNYGEKTAMDNAKTPRNVRTVALQMLLLSKVPSFERLWRRLGQPIAPLMIQLTTIKLKPCFHTA